MPLDPETKRLVVAIKDNYYDPRAKEKFLSYAPNTSYSQYLDILYQLCAFLIGHHHPGQLSAADAFRLLDNPLITQKVEEVLPRLKADVLNRLTAIHGSPAKGQEAFDALIAALMKNAPPITE